MRFFFFSLDVGIRGAFEFERFNENRDTRDTEIRQRYNDEQAARIARSIKTSRSL